MSEFQVGDIVTIEGTVAQVGHVGEQNCYTVFLPSSGKYYLDGADLELKERPVKEPAIGSKWINGREPDYYWIYLGNAVWWCVNEHSNTFVMSRWNEKRPRHEWAEFEGSR